MSILHATPDTAPPCPEPGCGLLASQVTSREISATTHEITGSCKRGHLWTTRWFAKRGE